MKNSEKQSSTRGVDFDFEKFEKEAIEGLYAGRGLVGTDGVLTGLIQRLVNAALEGEMRHHMKNEKLEGHVNRRNGHVQKELQTQLGPVPIQTPRDRSGEFEPQLIGKWNRKLGTGLEDQILSMYAHGSSCDDICHQLKSLYGLEYSKAAISEITDQIWPEVLQWQQRPLLAFYTVIFLDGIYFTTRESGKAVRKVIYTVYGVTPQGERDILGVYIREEEGAREWGKVVDDLRKRGVKDVLFFCVDGLTGFGSAIQEVFPKSIIQRCIVHMIRSSTKYVSDKDIKKVCSDLRPVYAAADESSAKSNLEVFKDKWQKKYPEIAELWEKSWTELVAFLDYGEHTRRMIYTTNAIENVHRQVRKVSKTKGSWATDKALQKQIYLTLMYGRKGWDRKVFQWASIKKELIAAYGFRFEQWVE
jgi:putative transposase